MLDPIEPLKLYTCSTCGIVVYQQPRLWKGRCHGCSGDCLLGSP